MPTSGRKLLYSSLAITMPHTYISTHSMIPTHLLDQLEEALLYGGAQHTLSDVVEMVSAGDAQMWHEGDALLVTEIITNPRGVELHFWLAAGSLDEVVTLSNRVMEWGKKNGCERATLSGRRGWVRALAKEGWKEELVLMGRELG